MSNVVVPQLGESVVEARIAKWLKQPGDRVNTGDALVSLETDKVDVEVPADHSGTLVSIAHPEGADVKVGEVIGVLEAGDGPGATAPAAAPSQTAAKAAETRATPTARRMAASTASALPMPSLRWTLSMCVQVGGGRWPVRSRTAFRRSEMNWAAFGGLATMGRA